LIQKVRGRLRSEILRIEGLIALLMKPRNGVPWSKEEKALLHGEMRRLARITPACYLFLLPGGALLLPLYAWFLDTRGARRVASPESGPSSA
jgi:hypothetical protein